MKHSWLVRTLVFAGCLGLITPLSPALAAGTAANTPVSNQATLDYQVGGVAQPPIVSDDDGIPGNGLNPTVFVVDNRVDLTMTGGTQSVTPGSTGRVLVFSVTNTGNATQGYALDLGVGAGAEDTFDMTGVTVYLDLDKSGTVTAGDTVYVPGSGNNIADVVANGGVASTIQVLVVADTPLTAIDGQTARYSLKAKTLNAGTTTESVATPGINNPASVDVVLADANAGAGVGGVSDGLRDGDFLATGTYTVQNAALSITKTVAVVSDPINGVSPNAKAIPGATVRYTIAIANAGAVASTNVVLTDTIPTNTDFLVGSVTDSTATGTIDYSNGAFGYPPVGAPGTPDPVVVAVRVSIPNIAGSGGSATVTFDVIIE